MVEGRGFYTLTLFLLTRSYLINRSEGEQDTPADAKETFFDPVGRSMLPRSTLSTVGWVYEMRSTVLIHRTD
jgi:hypothetical protein